MNEKSQLLPQQQTGSTAVQKALFLFSFGYYNHYITQYSDCEIFIKRAYFIYESAGHTG